MTWILPKQLHTLACALDTAALSLDSNESSQVCAQSLFVRSSPLPVRTWSAKWKRDSWSQHLFGRILKPSLGNRFATAWTSSLAVTPANHSVQQASDWGGGDIRHLWPHISRGISVLRPRVCFFENVEGHITCGLHHVLCDLGRLGYRTTWGIFSASECGAPHQRKRVFILAYRKEQGLEGYGGLEQSGIRNDTWPSRPSKPQYGWEPPRVVGNTDCRRLEGASARGREPAGNVVWTSELGNTESGMSGQSGAGNWWEGAGGAGEAGEAEWQTQPSLGGDLDGSASGMDYAQLCVTCDNRTDELRLLGNGVVPATAALAFRTLAAEFGDRGQP